MICNNGGERKSEGDINQARDHYSADNTVSQSGSQNQNKGKCQPSQDTEICTPFLSRAETETKDN